MITRQTFNTQQAARLLLTPEATEHLVDVVSLNLGPDIALAYGIIQAMDRDAALKQIEAFGQYVRMDPMDGRPCFLYDEDTGDRIDYEDGVWG